MRTSIAQGLVLSVAFGVMTSFASSSMHPRFEHASESAYMQEAVYAGKPILMDGKDVYFAQLYNRQLSPAAVHLVQSAGIPPLVSFRIVRIAFAIASFFALFLLVTRAFKGSMRSAITAQALLAAGMIATFNHGWEYNSDYLDLVFFFSYVWLALKRWRWAFAAAIILGVCNRESAALGGLLWLFLWGGKKLKETAFALGISAAGCAWALALRHAVAANILSRDPLAQNMAHQQVLVATIPELFFRSPAPLHPFAWPSLLVMMFIPAAVWLWDARQQLDPEGKRMLWAAAAIAATTCLFGYIDEPRIFLPAFAVMLAVAARAQAAGERP